MADREVCRVRSGTIISLQSYSHESGKVTAKILVQPESDEDLCDDGDSIELDNTVVNNFKMSC